MNGDNKKRKYAVKRWMGHLGPPLGVLIGLGIGVPILMYYSELVDFFSSNKAMTFLIIEMLFYGFSGFFILLSIYKGYWLVRSWRWPQVTGVVLKNESQIIPFHGRYRRQDYYIHKAQYAYEVEGQKYVSNRITYGTLPSKPIVPSQESEVLVYYDPGEPSRSILIHGGSQRIVLFFLMGLGVLLMGLLIFQPGVLMQCLFFLRTID